MNKNVACILRNFLLLKKNSAAVRSAWKYRSVILQYVWLFVIFTYQWLILYTLFPKSLFAVSTLFKIIALIPNKGNK